MAYLKNTWTKLIISKFHSLLWNVKIGWYDISLSNYEVSESSINKFRKLMMLVKCMMEVRNCIPRFHISFDIK